MSITSPRSRNPGSPSSYVVDIDAELSPTTTLASKTSNSPFTSPNVDDHLPSFTSNSRGTTSAGRGPLAGFQQLFKSNPSKVISGRYTINFRQILSLVCIVALLMLLWVYATVSRAGFDLGQSDLDSSSLRAEASSHRSPIPSIYDNNYENQAVAQDRYERVRGKGCRTSLQKIQFNFPKETVEERTLREQRLKQVREGFAHAWNGYKKYAWGYDEVRPVSGGHRSSFNGWGATMVDSLDTLIIMGFNKEFDEALDWVKNSFDMSKDPVAQHQFFETIIRYMGGFLSAYDLTGEAALLEKAEMLGNHVLNAFQNEDFPSSRFTIQKSANPTASNFVLAEIGTIQLEFSRLSVLTKNSIYQEKAYKVVEKLSTFTSGIPGLLPMYIQDVKGRHYSSYTATVGGMTDSYYEYLLKEWIMMNGKGGSALYKQMYEVAAKSVADYMAMPPDDGSKDYVVLGTVSADTKRATPEMEHLACFMGGTLAMGSKYYNRPTDLTLAKQVTEGCYLTYTHSETGLGPERMVFSTGDSADRTFTPKPKTFYDRSVSDRRYILRPETLESLWVLYRLTGDKSYQEKAWNIFLALEKNCRTEIAYSGLNDVDKIGSYDDKMESFFLAETMKYLYLMFSTPDVISLDDFVLNTEAHPFRRT
ncbi:hypothetical protein BGW38_004440 [Lunasporangiospora selenospora]|uniref:alpha-1,2-Mannosidase n=1 Tax=Lunasporangiospora selenospora TaxID=979761 RepID=A0A9P6KC61_9FUNG|nr:hypothetical protein BGW38_004440 [Lunasporangiospora selenospora]